MDLNEAIAAHRGGDYQRAELLLRSYTAEHENDELGFSYLGCSLRCQGKLSEAILAYEQASVLNPDYLWPLHYKLQCQLNLPENHLVFEVKNFLNLLDSNDVNAITYLQGVLHLSVVLNSKSILNLINSWCYYNDFLTELKSRNWIVFYYKMGFYLKQNGFVDLSFSYFDLLDKIEYSETSIFSKEELMCIYRAKSYALEKWQDRIKISGQRIPDDKNGDVRLPKKQKTRMFKKFPLKIEDFENVENVFKGTLFSESSHKLPVTSKVVTLGSCFAANLSKSLNDIGIRAEHLALSESTNNTYSTLKLLKGIFEEKSVSERSNKCKFVESQMIVITIGVSLGFFKSVGGTEITVDNRVNIKSIIKREKNCSEVSDGDVYFRKICSNENLKNLREINSLLRKYNKKARLIYTLSPIPLESTFSMDSIIEDDCLSKSTLKVALSEFISEQKDDGNLFYWPSFEAIKWIGAHRTGNLFNFGDSRHIDPDYIKLIMENFKTAHFC